MRLDMILMMGAAFAGAGTLLGWLTLWPSFRRQARDLRMRDWNLAHLRAMHTDREQLFLVNYVKPSIPEMSIYPQMGTSIAAVLAFAAVAWLLSVILIESIRDHAL